MKSIFFVFITFLGTPVCAESGYSQIEKLFSHGQELNLQSLRTIDQGIYVGRCFGDQTNYPYGAFVTFKNISQDSGPIVVDPEVYVSTGSSQKTDYYDKIVVSDLVAQLQLYKAEKLEDKITYEVLIPGWSFQYRQSGDYIVQRNFANGVEDSYCYYYSFRSK